MLWKYYNVKRVRDDCNWRSSYENRWSILDIHDKDVDKNFHYIASIHSVVNIRILKQTHINCLNMKTEVYTFHLPLLKS